MKIKPVIFMQIMYCNRCHKYFILEVIKDFIAMFLLICVKLFVVIFNSRN